MTKILVYNTILPLLFSFVLRPDRSIMTSTAIFYDYWNFKL